MAVNLIPYCNLQNGTDYGITFTWQSDYSCRLSGTSTDIAVNDLCYANIGSTPFYAGHDYDLKFSCNSSAVDIRIYFYTANWGSMISYFVYTGDASFSVPSNCGAILFRLRVARGATLSNVVARAELYDQTYSDVDADCEMMMSVLGYPNSWFYPKWVQFASGALWDGQSCSEIACCISYMAGNLSKIYVSNYAQGLADLFRANGRFGNTPSRGAFIWFDYDGDGVPDHTGRVYEVLPDGTIHTVEGNVGGLVRELYYAPNTSYIYGYGYPNYNHDPAAEPPEPTPPKFIYLPYFRHKRRERGL